MSDVAERAETASNNTHNRWYYQPRYVLSMLAILVFLSAVLTPTPRSGRAGDPRLSTYNTDPQGARILYELAGRLNWKVERETRDTVLGDASTIIAVLDPTVELTSTNVHHLMQHARNGGALLVVLGDGTKLLSDSLKVSVNDTGSTINRVPETRTCPMTVRMLSAGLWPGLPTLFGLNVPPDIARKATTFVETRKVDHTIARDGTRQTNEFGARPSVIGFPLGSGRVVVASDPDVFRNDALRVCIYNLDVPAVRELTFLADSGTVPRTTIVFDEYHQSRGLRTGTIGLIQRYFLETQSGHAVFQLCAAGLLLLLAAAARVQPPREDVRLVRRSPLEHVDALARAYAQVGATRTAVLRLVRGLRRRVDRSAPKAGTVDRDEWFLARVADTKPALAHDVALVRNALTHASSQAEFKEVGSALARIEAAFTSS